ncbi:MAG: flagellar biosynthesis protein FlhB [Steroidobacteraceae bacterium]
MADTDQEDRTESATPKRQEEARKKGQVPRSRDLNSAAVTLLSCAALTMFGERMVGALANMMRQGLSPQFAAGFNTDQMFAVLRGATLDSFMAVLPVLMAGFVAAILAPMSISGWNFSTEALAPDFSRLNPISGFGRLFSSNGLIELAKSVVKFAVVGAIAVMVLRKDSSALLNMGNESLFTAMQHAASLCTSALMVMACGMLLIAGVDVPIQLWQHAKQLKMSRDEVKQEMKESEGSPEVKGKIRRLQQEAARRRMMTEVPKADVIITNPTHYAVALRYDDSRNRAPIVVAKGVDEVAAKIRELATEHKVPIFEAPPLARVLYRSVDLNKEIPASLYTAVAQVLTYIFQLRAYKKGEMQMYPDKPKVEVDEFAHSPGRVN